MVFILNVLSELDFFKDENVSISFTLFLSLLNSPIQIFELLGCVWFIVDNGLILIILGLVYFVDYFVELKNSIFFD